MKVTKHLSEHKKALIWLALIWTGFVIYMCLKSFHNLPKFNIKNLDKLVHFCFHFGISFLWFLYFKITKLNLFKTASTKALLISLILGIVIEICQQQFTTTRKADFFDVLANTIGAMVSIVFLYFVFIKWDEKEITNKL